MILSDLAEVFVGLKLSNDMVRDIGDYGYHKSGITSKYVNDKELRRKYRVGEYSRFLLSYGDYLLDTVKSSGPVLFRYENIEKKTIVSDDFIVIRTETSYLMNYLSNPHNKENFFNQINHGLKDERSIYEIVSEISISDTVLDIQTEKDTYDREYSQSLDIGKLNIRQQNVSIGSIKIRLKRSMINMSTPFQRKAGLWADEVKSRLIEAYMVGLPIPAYFFEATDNQNWLVIDGLQRLSAIKEFIEDKLILKGLYYLSELEGKKYSDLSDIQKLDLEEKDIYAHLILEGTPNSIKYRVFHSINTSQLKLTNQEIRHALNQGVAANLVEFLGKKLDSLFGDGDKDRMLDREYGLLYLAFKHKHFTNYTPDFQEYLDKVMDDIRITNEAERNKYIEDFDNSLKCIRKLFGEDFKFDTAAVSGVPPRKGRRINRLLFAILTVGFSKEYVRKIDSMNNIGIKDFNVQLIQMATASGGDFLSLVERNDAWTKENVQAAFRKFDDFLKTYFND